MYIPYDPDSTFSSLPKRNENILSTKQTNKQTNFLLVLFMISPTWKLLKYLSTIMWINELCKVKNGILLSNKKECINGTFSHKGNSQKKVF